MLHADIALVSNPHVLRKHNRVRRFVFSLLDLTIDLDSVGVRNTWFGGRSFQG